MKQYKMTEKNNNRAHFATRIGAVATAAGSAVGLGNIWRFPYETGTHGGGAFIFLYIMFIMLIGVPVLCAEFIMGRQARANEIDTFRKLAPGQKWYLAGYLGLAASIMILSFYSVVAGWTMEYFYMSVTGALSVNADRLHEMFGCFVSDFWRPLLWTLIFLGLNLLVIIRGVQKGIERISNILMPMMLILLIVFCINSLLLPNAAEGLSFMFKPDFSKTDSSTLLSAMGQAFFSLSIGLGCMMTYGSYFSPTTRLGRCAATTALLDTAIAILAGVIIFPAVFSYGISPQAGPTLVFETLPAIFINMKGGYLWASAFFALLFLASITSTISMSEITIAYLTEKKNMSRKKACCVVIGTACVLASLCSLSFGPLSSATVCGLTVFNLFDYVASNLLLPIGGLIIAIFAGWRLDRRIVEKQMSNDGLHSVKLLKPLRFCLRYIAPAGILLILLNSIGII